MEVLLLLLLLVLSLLPLLMWLEGYSARNGALLEYNLADSEASREEEGACC